MDQNATLSTMCGMLAVTHIPRVLPVWLFSSKSLPPPVIAWLRFVPVAVLAAMLLPSLVVSENHLDLTLGNLFLWAAIPTLLVAWKTRSLRLSNNGDGRGRSCTSRVAYVREDES